MVAAYTPDGRVLFSGDGPTAKLSGYAGTKLMWLVAPEYSGNVTITGTRMGGGESMKFGDGPDAYSLTLVATGKSEMQSFPTNEWISLGGCYRFTIRGDGFDELIDLETTTR